MKKRNGLIKGILAGCCLLVIILDGKTALNAAGEGIDLCIRTVIPALFPFFFLSGIISSCLLGRNIKALRLLGRLCKLPKGSESILLVGFLSGYPVGAQLVNQAYKTGIISKENARRMLGFCSNAGPSFLFGMLIPFFDNIGSLLVLWAVHIASALLVGKLIPAGQLEICVVPNTRPLTVPQALRKAVENIALVCGWIVLFRVILGFCNHWFLWMFPIEMQILLSGLLELSNGCVLLGNIPIMGAKFILAGAMLSFGGICVMMQTSSVTQGTGLGMYFPGKLLQTLLSLTMCCVLQSYLFPIEHTVNISVYIHVLLFGLTFITAISFRGKKVVAFQKKMLYNTGS